MSENRVQIVIEGDASSLKVAVQSSAKGLLDLSAAGDKASVSMKGADAATAGMSRSAREGTTATASQSQALRDADVAAVGFRQSLRDLAEAYGAYRVAKQGYDSVVEAARYETMSVVLHTVGNAAGYTREQTDAYAAALERQGISMLGAQESLTRMLQGQIDLEKGVRLATAAQGAAIVMNRSSTEAFETMTTAIATGLVINLHRMGVMADFERAYEREAAALHKSKEELTDRERVQARTNETLAKTKMLEDVYAAAMGTAGKQALSMIRYLSDLSVMTGSIGLGVFTEAVFGSAAALKDLNERLRQLTKDGTIATWSRDAVSALNQLLQVLKLTAEVSALFWLAWKGSVAIESALLSLGLLKLELRALAAEITAAGGALSWLNAQLATTVAAFTTLSGILTGIAALVSGILIGKYLVENFKWAASAALSMGETIQIAVTEFVGYFKTGVAELSGDTDRIAEAHRALARKLLTIKMTYLHERAELEKKFAAPQAPALAPEVLGSMEDQKVAQSKHKADAVARKIQEARKMLTDVQSETAVFQAEAFGDRLRIEMAKLDKELDHFEIQAKEKSIGAPAEAQRLIDMAVQAKRKEIEEKRRFTRESIALDEQKLAAEREVQLAGLQGVDAYYADIEAIRKKYAAARLKPGSQDAQWADVMEPAELAKRQRDQLKANAERNLGLQSELNKSLSEIYATSSGRSITGQLSEQAQAVELERQQKLIVLSEKLRAAEEAIYEVRRRTGDALGPQDQEEMNARQQELELVNALIDATNSLASIKQQEIAASRDWQYGARKGFQDYAETASNYSSQAENAVRSSFDGMNDSLASFVVKGKGNWSSLVDTILMDLVKIQMRSSVTGPLSNWLGGLDLFRSANGNVLSGPGISALEGGIYSQPTFFGFDQHISAFAKGGVLGEAGPEVVLPLTRDSSGTLGVRSFGGGAQLNATFYFTLPQSSGSQSQDQRYLDQASETMRSGLDTWWQEQYRQAQRPGAIGNGGVSL